eukprot:s3590_g11.t1
MEVSSPDFRIAHSGPKSGDAVTHLTTHETDQHRREGQSSPSGRLEAASAVNLGGDTGNALNVRSLTLSRIRKRSFKRAVKRAQLHGETMYRGKLLRAQPPLLPVAEEEKESVKPRIHFMSWNVGGLSSVLYAEICVWLQQPEQLQIGIFLLQETHWDFTADWTTNEWCLCHSTTGKKGSGGVLVGIRKGLVDPESIRWHEHVPGRLLQVRCLLGKQQLDIINLYQHAYLNQAGQADAVMQKRKQLWNKMDTLLVSLPARSHIILGGDFNTQLREEPKLVGPGILSKDLTDKERSDRELPMQALLRHRLCVLNTWGAKKKACTYRHPKASSQIDYVCVRQPLADGKAKQTRPKFIPLAGWRTVGHHPLLGSVPLRWTPWTRQAAARAASDFANESRIKWLGAHPQRASVHELRRAVKEVGVAPPEKPSKPPLEEVNGMVLSGWNLRRSMAAAQSRFHRGMKFIFLYFWLKTKYQKAHRQLKKELRARKRRQTLLLLEQAENAAHCKDSRTLFGIIRLMCPSGRSQRIRIRGREGQLLNGEEECEVLASYAQKLFQGTVDSPLPLQPLPAELFGDSVWLRALRGLKAEKAVPTGTPPLRNWKRHPQEIAACMGSVARAHLCTSRPTIPSQWLQVQLAWLAKPKKCPNCPENLRSIGLMAGDTKLFMMALKESTSGYVMRSLRDVPQFAYRALASTVDALLRGSDHCSRVRSLLQHVHTDTASRILGDLSQTEVKGGIMVSLDLAKAFDCLPYTEMYHSLRESDVPDPLARFIIEVHRQTQCIIRHAGHQRTISMTRGLRQGCPLAPCIFAAWTARLCRKLGIDWAQQHSSFFADDVHGYWCVESVEQFHTVRKHILRLVQCLNESGMNVNFKKSVAVLVLRGSAAAQLKSRFIKWRGGRYVLVVGWDPVAQSDITLPVEDKLEYLGVVLSYGAMETQSLQLPNTRAWTNYTKLKSILRTNSIFGRCHRLRVFKARVVPALLYGLIGVGFSAASLRELRSILARMLRKVLRVYEHGITNQEVLNRASVDLPGVLRQQLLQKRDAAQADPYRAPALVQATVERTQVILVELDRIQALPDSGLIEVDRTEEAVDCPICGLAFPNARSLDAHYSAKHPEIHRDSRTPFNRREHALFGLPQCRLCRARLFDWASLERHITEGRCARLKQATAEGKSHAQLMQQVLTEEISSPPIPPSQIEAATTAQQQFPDELLRCPLSTLPGHAKVVAGYTYQCILCSQRVKDSGHMKNHWRAIHFDAWQAARQDALSSAQSLRSTFTRPCQYCGSMAKHGNNNATHHATKCSPLFQVLAARKLQREGSLEMHMQACRGPALKQREKPKQYDQLENHDVAAQLRARGQTFSTTASGETKQDKAKVAYGGGTMLSLALPSEDCDLQELVSRWHEQTELHALLEEVRYVPLFLGRYPARGKIFVQVRFRQHVNLPVFVDQMNVRWVRYYCVAGLVHDGELPTSGHYRALLRDEVSPETWYVTDDHRVAVPCSVANYHHSNVYVLWLKKL